MPPRTNEEVKAHRIFQMLPNNSKRIVLNGPLLGGQERGNAGNYNPKTGQYRYLPSRNEYLDLLNRIDSAGSNFEQSNMNRLEFIRGKHLKDALPMRQEVIDRKIREEICDGNMEKYNMLSDRRKRMIQDAVIEYDIELAKYIFNRGVAKQSQAGGKKKKATSSSSSKKKVIKKKVIKK